MSFVVPSIFETPLADLTREDFEYFQQNIFKLAGISLSAAKADLLKTRLRTQVQKHGFVSYTEYRKFLCSLSPAHEEWQEFINLLTTNKTDFFREPQHFTYLENVFIPEWLHRGGKNLKVWCAASSTGEEPYTLALVLNRALPKHINFHITASDIDTKVLEKAENGVYSIRKLPEIPEAYRFGHLALGKGEIAEWFKIKSPLREKLTFMQHNLVDESFPSNEQFDLIFCRNVLIYFSPPTIGTLMQKLDKCLDDRGNLLIGHSESIQNSTHLFKSVKPSIYKKAK